MEGKAAKPTIPIDELYHVAFCALILIGAKNDSIIFEERETQHIYSYFCYHILQKVVHS